MKYLENKRNLKMPIWWPGFRSRSKSNRTTLEIYNLKKYFKGPAKISQPCEVDPGYVQNQIGHN
jgi:hypothetical protein